ncbi:MAG TPA: alpha-glucosidase [Bryobacteraceae bacterium]|jgi:alpha-glucosidase|nr:alpha-glucosidase [Bryobacteraceae bacterium]
MRWLRGLLFFFAIGVCLGADNDWWRTAVIYEVYPRSFGDSNGDGVGDLNGITEHLDYLKDLGVDAIWITPFYPSPQVDFGYDISDYRAIDSQFGTMADFDRLMAEAKKRNIRVINDLVLNHTSDQHPWFIESKSSRTNPKANWYIWHDPKPGGGPPNNWQSIFGHSAWQYEDSRKQYYYHAFYKQQPDLNWRDNDVRKAMYDVMRFWMDKGVAGFRLDAITSLFEDLALKDEPYLAGMNAYGDRNISRIYTDNLPEVHDVLRDLRKVVNQYPGRVLIGEVYLPNVGELAKMYGRNRDELQLPMDTKLGFYNHLSVPVFRSNLSDPETKINGNVPLLVFSNHDNPRAINRFGDGTHDAAIARLLATLLLTPRDAALIYYGEEIGMVTTPPKRKEDVRDPVGKLGWPKDKGRDGERTPMQWNGKVNAGFSTAKQTWLPVAPDYKSVNVAVEEQKPDSLLNYYKALIRLRKENPQLRTGDFVLVDTANANVLSYIRKTNDGQAVLVSLNFTPDPQTVSIDLDQERIKGTHLKKLIASYSAGQGVGLHEMNLPAYGSFVGQVEP